MKKKRKNLKPSKRKKKLPPKRTADGFIAPFTICGFLSVQTETDFCLRLYYYSLANVLLKLINDLFNKACKTSQGFS